MKKRIKIIAEAGINHNGNIRLAYKLINKAKYANADAVKFQIFSADELVSKSKQSVYKNAKKLELSRDEHLKLRKYCKKKGITYLCSAFDIPSLKFLHKQKISLFKIPSGEITNFPYLKIIGSFKKEVILSTGMSTISEIGEALEILVKAGLNKKKITLLQCNSDYPTKYSEVNLNAMLTLKKKFNVKVGLSDHTIGIEVPIAAAALGAKVIEKHFTLDRNMKGPDHKASLTPSELVNMVNSVRNIENSLGSKKKIVTKSELKTLRAARKSIVAIKDIKKNEIFNKKNIGTKRPGTGLSAKEFEKVIGKKAKKFFKRDELIKI